jgi:hypothetical protein
MENCKRCSKEIQHLAVTHPKIEYTICWDCLIHLDINGKDWKKFKNKA